jgi:hypothetical protein
MQTQSFGEVMKRVLKMFALLFVSVVGVMGIVLGVFYLFGGFNEKIIYAENLAFNSEENIYSGTFALQVDTTTEDVTQTTLVLETSNGGEDVIEYPRTVTIGESFRISPKKVGSTDVNVGGYVVLYAHYSGATSSQSVIASCKILVDVEIEQVTIDLPQTVVEVNESVKIASQGDSLSTLLGVYPTSSLSPYSSRSVFGTVDSTSKFSTINLLDKKIFLEVFSTDSNESVNSLLIDGETGTNVIEVPYEYDETLGTFVFSKDIYITPDTKIGGMRLKAYFSPTYSSLSSADIENLSSTTATTTLSQQNFSVINYTINGLSMDTADKTVYLNEDNSFYINNSQKDNNLNITLFNNNQGEIEDSVYKNNIYISVVTSGVSYILTKSNGDTTKTTYGMNAYVDDYSNISEWCWNFKLTDFLAYYNYTSASTQTQKDASKIEMKVVYYDGTDNTFEKTFYIVPNIHEVDSLSVKYSSATDTSFYLKSGSVFQLTKSNFNFTYDTTPTFSDLAYYIPYTSTNTIVTTPTSSGTYTVEFDFSVSSAGSVSNFDEGDWCKILSSSVVFSQGTKSYSIPYSADGTQGTNTQVVEFSANTTIHCQFSLTVTTVPETSDILFSFNIGDTTVNILGNSAKFYKTNSTLPVLLINDVAYAVDFEYYTDTTTDEEYIHILSDNSTYVLTGIGSFSMLAEVVYQGSSGEIYWLGESAGLNVYSYTELTSLVVKSFDPTSSTSSYFSRDGISFDEDVGTSAVGYLFVTCDEDQLDALKKYYENGNLSITFAQNYGETSLDYDDYNSVSIGQNLDEINADAITFGSYAGSNSWLEVTDGNGSFLGYYISYYIHPIYSIVINSEELSNIFDISVVIETNSGDDLTAGFAYSSDYTESTLEIDINDITLTDAQLSYSGTSNGTSQTSPVTLTAKIVAGELVWNDGSSSYSDIPVRYAFVYSDGSTTTTSYMTESLANAQSTSNVVSNVGGFHSFTINTSGSGGLTFKNFPYYDTNGSLVQLHIYCTNSQADATTHYEWNGSSFVQTINSALADGAYLYFKIIGLNLEVTANNVSNLVGCSGNEFTLFGEDGLFTLTNGGVEVSGVSDYSQFFTVNSINSYVSVDDAFTKITVTNDFLVASNVNISFSYVNSQKLSITSTPGTTVESYAQSVSGAFTIETTQNFLAPSLNQTFYTLTYRGADQSAVDNVNVSLSQLSTENGGDDSANATFTINTDGTLSFNAMTGTKTAKIRITLSLSGTSLTENKDVSITIVSKYSSSQLTVGTLDETSGNYQVSAGAINKVETDNGITFSGNLLSDKESISSIVLSFANSSLNSSAQNTLLATEHMKAQTYSTYYDAGFYSYDLNYNKFIDVTFTFSYANGGTFVCTKTVEILSNISISINITAEKSGDTVNFDSATFTVSKTNENNENLVNTDYEKSNFIYDSTYFEDVTSERNGTLLILSVRYPSETLLEQSGVETTITFVYQPDNVDYTLSFDYVLTLDIQGL